MFLKKLNSTFIVLTVMTAVGFIMSNQQAKAAYTDYCPYTIGRSGACAPGETRVEANAQRFCATLIYSNGALQACCSYQGINSYCIAEDGTRNRAPGGQDAEWIGTQENSTCKFFKCVYNTVA